jgi:hypothetical protein
MMRLLLHGGLLLRAAPTGPDTIVAMARAA